MAKIERISKSRKECKCSKCGNVIPVGSSYLKATPYRATPIIRCIKCGLKSYETSSSEFVRSVGEIAEDWSDNYSLEEGTAESIANDLEEIRDQQQDSLDNMPENLQEGDTGVMLQERIEMLDSVIDELNDISWEDCESEAKDEVESDWGDYDPEDEEYDTEDEFKEAKDERARELAFEKLSELIDDTVSSLEY